MLAVMTHPSRVLNLDMNNNSHRNFLSVRGDEATLKERHCVLLTQLRAHSL